MSFIKKDIHYDTLKLLKPAPLLSMPIDVNRLSTFDGEDTLVSGPGKAEV